MSISLHQMALGIAGALVSFSSLLVSAQAGTIAQRSDDIQILQAWTTRQSAQLPMNPAEKCKLTDNVGEHPNMSLYDCSASAPVNAPAAAPWTTYSYPADGRSFSPTYRGNLVEIRAVIKKSVLASPAFTGVGFYAQNMTFRGLHFIPRNQLQAVSSQDVTLSASGEKAVVLRFVLWFPGWQGNSGTGWCMNSVEFKPAALFQANGNLYENWDPVSQNYRLYRCPIGSGNHQAASINREFELLRR